MSVNPVYPWQNWPPQPIHVGDVPPERYTWRHNEFVYKAPKREYQSEAALNVDLSDPAIKQMASDLLGITFDLHSLGCKLDANGMYWVARHLVGLGWQPPKADED